MLVLNYVPLGNKGILTPDGEVESTVREWIQQAADLSVTLTISVGHSLPVMALRALVREGVTTKDDCVIQFNGEDLELTSDGKLVVWPRGFCDVEDDLLDRLL